MAAVRIPLDLVDSSVTGVYMENLISFWCCQGLTPEQGKVLVSVIDSSTRLDELFAKCLDKDKGVFEIVRNQMMRTLNAWEEIPAWDEIWRLKLAFDKGGKIDWHPTVKLYTVIVCKVLPEMIMERPEHEDAWNPPLSQQSGSKDPMHLSGNPEWYKKKFEEYQARQAEREKDHQRDQEAILRYKALTRGDSVERDSGFRQRLPLSEDDLAALLQKPCGYPYPMSWWLALQKAGIDTSLGQPNVSSWQVPNFSDRRQNERQKEQRTEPKFNPFQVSSTKPTARGPSIFSSPFAKQTTSPFASKPTSIFGHVKSESDPAVAASNSAKSVGS